VQLPLIRSRPLRELYFSSTYCAKGSTDLFLSSEITLSCLLSCRISIIGDSDQLYKGFRGLFFYFFSIPPSS